MLVKAQRLIILQDCRREIFPRGRRQREIRSRCVVLSLNAVLQQRALPGDWHRTLAVSVLLIRCKIAFENTHYLHMDMFPFTSSRPQMRDWPSDAVTQHDFLAPGRKTIDRSYYSVFVSCSTYRIMPVSEDPDSSGDSHAVDPLNGDSNISQIEEKSHAARHGPVVSLARTGALHLFTMLEDNT